jgi:hypothetical protein
MADKTKTSPLKQGWAGSIIGNMANQVQVPPPTTSTNNGYLWGMGGAAAIGAQQQPISSGSIMGGAAGAVNTAMKRMPTNPNSLKEKVTATKAARKAQQMNPKATGNNATVKSVFGQEQVPGSYNRSMSALPQTQEINPILPPTTNSQPVPPPEDVQQAITPTYDLSNQ